MKFSTTSVLSAALFVAGVSAQLTVNTPTNVIQCAPLTITWTASTPPYFLSLHSGADVNGTPLFSFPSTNATQLTWNAVNYPAGTQLDLTLRDSAGASSQSAIFTVQTGGDTGCLNGTANSTSPSVSAAAPAGSATTPVASGSSTNKATPAAASSSSASSASKPASTSNGAMVTGVQYSVAGLLGAVVAALIV